MIRLKRRVVVAPVGTAMAWLWAIGTVGTLVGLGMAVDQHLHNHQAELAVSVPDAAPPTA